MAACSGAASIAAVTPSLVVVIRPAPSRVISSASARRVPTSTSFLQSTSSDVRTRFNRSSSTSDAYIAYSGCGSQAVSASATGADAVEPIPTSGMRETIRPSTGFTTRVAPSTTAYEIGWMHVTDTGPGS